jgi:hypothetical protein
MLYPHPKTCLCFILFKTSYIVHKIKTVVNLIISHQISLVFHVNLPLIIENAVSVSIKHFITLLILMKGGTSQYSRPTTAKKGFPSPKILKRPEERTKVKT